MSENKENMLSMDYRKNDMIDELLQRYYLTYSCTLDTIDFVGTKTDKKIHKYIFKNMKKSWRKIDKQYNKDLLNLFISDSFCISRHHYLAQCCYVF